jgi:hypothetical protein
VMRHSIIFLIILSVVHLHARTKKNGFIELGNYLYTSFQLLDCGFVETNFTITPSTARFSKIKSCVVFDTTGNRRALDFIMEFDRSGRVTRFRKYVDEYKYEYDSTLELQGINRISLVTYNEWSDGHIFRQIRTHLTYDEFGNPIGMSIGNYADSCTAFFKYKNSLRFQYVFVTGCFDGDNAQIVFRYDKKTGMLYQNSGKGKFNLLGVVLPSGDHLVADTARSGEKYFDCIDTIPDGRYESIFVHPEDYNTHSIKRDTLGRIIQIGAGQRVWRSTEYSDNGLPESANTYYFDGTKVHAFLFEFTFYDD